MPEKSFEKQIEDIRKMEAPKLDSQNKKFADEVDIYDGIRLLILSGKLTLAGSEIKQMLERDSTNVFLHSLKGQLYDAEMKYDSAIYEYDIALYRDNIPNILDKRAATYIKMKKFDMAIRDLRNAFEQNSDFGYKFAQAFELTKQNDSALKYYNLYLEQYSDSLYKQLKFQGITLEYGPDSARAKINKLQRK